MIQVTHFAACWSLLREESLEPTGNPPYRYVTTVYMHTDVECRTPDSGDEKRKCCYCISRII